MSAPPTPDEFSPAVLAQLRRLPVDRLKIDRTFVTEITGSARGSSIAEMVIQLGRNLGLSVIAEGVEDERQAQILRELGCPLAQGFLYSRPLSPEALLEAGLLIYLQSLDLPTGASRPEPGTR